MFAAGPIDPWRFQPHPEVWVLVAFLAGSYIYMVRVIGPTAVRNAPGGAVVAAVTRKQLICFVAAMALLWFGSDWPVHDIGEEYLYSAHMLQHMIFTYFMPPLALLATPEWMLRVLLGKGKIYKAASWAAKPVVAGVAFNLMVMLSHVPGIVNASTTNGPLHYSLHFLLVTLALMMWMPVVGPFAEWRISPLSKCIYLFLMSVVPTVPAGWLTFADGVVYKHYDQPVRVWGMTVIDDQQLAGAIMKLGGAVFLWVIVVFIFFRRFAVGFDAENTYVRNGKMPTSEITGHDEQTLTYEQVSNEFQRTAAPATVPARDDTTRE